ncbi:MAG TPA: hypothetical protein VF546_03465 [Pyrinomonadaceae bacterium]
MQSCTLILRRLVPGEGITETSLPVSSLEELFAHCVRAEAQLVERLLFTGRDAAGRPRLLTFTFQSVADHQQP